MSLSCGIFGVVRRLGPLGAAGLVTCALVACGDDGSSAFGNPGGSGGSTQGGGGTGGSASGGGSSGGGGGGGGGTGGSTASGGGDVGGMGGMGGTGGAGGGSSCDRNGIVTVSQSAATFGGMSGMLVYNGHSDAQQQSGDLLVVELWFQYGASDVPHTFTFSGENYLDCNECAVLMTDCVNGDCSRRFLVQSGTLEITTIDQANSLVEGSLHDVSAIEVTINPSTAVSTPVPGGETWCVSNHDFSASINALPGGVTKP